MESTILYYRFLIDSYTKGESDVWVNEPTQPGLVLYSMVTPFICLFGIFGNTLSLMVLVRKELKASVYTYLAVLAGTDLINSIILFLGGLCRGVLWQKGGWRQYDALIFLPVGAAVGTISVIATVFVALDRVIYLWTLSNCRPKFCCPKLARKFMVISTIISILFNVPYCFIYSWNENGDLITTEFFKSSIYAIHNWIRFVVFAVLPAIFLTLGNGFLIFKIKKSWEMKSKCNGCCKRKGKRPKDHTHLTITLVAIVFFFLIGEIPTHLVSRTTAVTLLFNGDLHKAESSQALQIARQISTVISAINIAANFVLYYLFCPAFCRVLRKMFVGRRQKRKTKTLQVNVFVVNGAGVGVTGDNRKMSFQPNIGMSYIPQPEKFIDLLPVDENSKSDSFPTSLNDEDDDDGSEDCNNSSTIQPPKKTVATICSYGFKT